MEWISVKSSLPQEEMRVWVCDSEKYVFDALWTNDCLTWDEPRPLKNKWGFAIEQLESYDTAIENIEYWMPYFKPEPPK
jgi:hypothetical protein